MPTHLPRVQVTLDEQSNGALAALASREQMSKSALAAQLIQEALELREDAALSRHADARLRETPHWHSHHEAWSE